MKKLYVGCRVRILWSESFHDIVGSEGWIVDVSDDEEGYGAEWVVSPDVWGSPTCPYEDSQFHPRSSQLEPIIDTGRKVVSWEECLWQPEHTKEGVTA